jgi:hypothetical protein
MRRSSSVSARSWTSVTARETAARRPSASQLGQRGGRRLAALPLAVLELREQSGQAVQRVAGPFIDLTREAAQGHGQGLGRRRVTVGGRRGHQPDRHRGAEQIGQAVLTAGGQLPAGDVHGRRVGDAQVVHGQGLRVHGHGRLARPAWGRGGHRLA